MDFRRRLCRIFRDTNEELLIDNFFKVDCLMQSRVILYFL